MLMKLAEILLAFQVERVCASGTPLLEQSANETPLGTSVICLADKLLSNT